ncbi:hypothetical protein EW026_g5526, partial [Hermanssonia centrifuga]
MSTPSDDASSECPDPLLRRPRPHYLAENRYSSGSGASTPSSSTSLSPPSAFPQYTARNSFGSFQSFNLTKEQRVNSFASSSLSALDSPFLGAGRPLSLGYEYTFSADLQSWASEFTPDFKEEDDAIHEPDPAMRHRIERDGHVFSWRGLTNLGTLVMFTVGIIVLFAGYPIITHFTRHEPSTFGAFNIGGTNASGQVPDLIGRFTIIDPDTPQEAYTKPSWADPSNNFELVWSDEFNTPGRSFYPGDDPYWEAVDLHYWGTNDLEWYDPAAITTDNGDLVITLSQKETHDLNYQGGLWPAVWTMGNLGRAGYGATLDGMWPYTYDACDIGTVANQSINEQPVAATINGDTGKGGILSYLPGQKLSRCTCNGESHPGPKHSDGSFVGRAAPEIDLFEAQITDGAPGDAAGQLTAQVSQSAQWAPFNAGYLWNNTAANEVIVDPTISIQNTFTGSATQQATSVVTNTDVLAYEYSGGLYEIYGYEYKPGFDDAYITWVSSNKVSWTLNVAGMGPDAATEISARPVPQEPMYIIANLGMSFNFGTVDLTHLPFPVHMRIDYIRVYQPSNARNVGCDPKDFPTKDYIN